MMAGTIRERIISAYLTRLTSWTTENGYNYACGSSVFRAVGSIEDADLPAVVVWPQSETVEQLYGRNVCTFVLKIEALAGIGTENKNVVQEKLLGDVIKIMTDPAVAVTPLINSIIYTGGGPAGIEKVEETVTAVSAEFKIEYETLIGNPYSQ